MKPTHTGNHINNQTGWLAVLLLSLTFSIQLVSGVHYVTIPVLMEQQGFGNLAIGFAIASEIIGLLLFHRRLHQLTRWAGLCWTLFILLSCRLLLGALMSQWQHYLSWWLGIFGYGLCTGMLLVLMQTWLSLLANRHRGLLMGLFSAALSLGVACGPLFVTLTGVGLSERFVLAASLNLLLLLLLPWCAQQQALTASSETRLPFVFRHARPVLVSAFIGGIAFYGLPNFLTLYGQHNGFAATEAVWLMSTFMLGSVTLGMLISLASDWLCRQRVILCCIFVAVVCGVFLSLAVYSSAWATYSLLYCWGGSMGAIYSIGLSIIGDRFHRSQQLPANLSYNMMDATGGIAGLLLIGAMMDLLGPEGLPLVLTVSGCLFLIYLSWELLHGRRFD